MKKRGRGRPRKINLASTDSIINATLNQLSKLSPKDLRTAYSRLRQTALKRLKRLRENQLDYLDIYKLNREEFAAKPSSMTDSEVAQALLTARNFLDNPTSTVRGAKKELQDRAQTIKETIDYDTNYGGIIDPSDPAMLRVWGDFMDTLRASSEYELVYDLSDLRELWNVYQRRANAETFADADGKHYKDLDEAFERFMESPDTIPLFNDETASGSKSAGKRQSERRRVQRILSQPFFVAEQFTGVKGVMVSIEDTIKGFNMILDGEVDYLPEQAFLNVGTIEDAIAKGEAILAAAK